MQAPAQAAADRFARSNSSVEQAQTNQEEDDANKCHACCDKVEPYVLVPKSQEHLLFFIPFWAAVIGVVIWFFVWAFPRIVEHAFEPATEAIQDALTPVQIGVVICFAVCLLPITIVLPSEPFVWLAAVVFSFPEALAIVMTGTIVGMAIPFIITRIWFRKSVLKFLHRYRYTAAMLLGVEKAGPFKTTVIMRLGPVPYPLVNYLMAIPEHMPFWKYETASIVGAFPGVLLGVIFGRNIKGLAAMIRGEKVPAGQMAYNLVSLGCTILLLVGGYVYAKRSLAQLEKEAQEAQLQDHDQQQQQAPIADGNDQPLGQTGAQNSSQGTGTNGTHAAHLVIRPSVISDPHTHQSHGVMTSPLQCINGDQATVAVTGVPVSGVQQHANYATHQFQYAHSHPGPYPYPYAYPYHHPYAQSNVNAQADLLYHASPPHPHPVSLVPGSAFTSSYTHAADHRPSLTAGYVQMHDHRPA